MSKWNLQLFLERKTTHATDCSRHTDTTTWSFGLRALNPRIQALFALNALQFAAKIHEALIIVSIGDILMGRINHHLLNDGDSLPLGFLPSPLLLNSPFSYLISSELWAPILSSRGRQRTQKATGAMIFLSALLCIAASPLSAITMIPRQGWRLMVNGIGSSSQVTYTPGGLYNNDLDGRFIPNSNYTHKSTWQARPSQKSILETTITKGHSSSGPFTNVTYSNYEATARPMSLKYGYQGMIATCPLSSVARHFKDSDAVFNLNPWVNGMAKAVYQEDASSTYGKWKQPVVSASCHSTSLKDGIANFIFSADPGIGPKEIFDTLEIRSADYPWIMEVSKNRTNSSGPLGYAFLNIKDSKQLPISADIMFATVLNETQERDTFDVVSLRPTVIVLTLCVIQARWTEADVWVEPDRSSDALSHFDFDTLDMNTPINESFGTPDFINIHQDWMAGIGSVSTTSANRSSYEEAHDFCMDATRPRSLDWQCVQTFLAMHVADAIAEVGQIMTLAY